MTETKWRHFADVLRNAIEEPRRGILLDAASEWVARSGDDTGKPSFRLPTGMCQESFITTWEILDESDLSVECVDRLADLVSSIHERVGGFSSIVGVSPPCRFLVESIHPRVRTFGGPLEEDGDIDLPMTRQDDIDIFYIGPHPVQSLEFDAFTRLAGQNVVIVTDVIASGTTVMDMARAIEQLCGKVIAVVCLIITHEDMATSVCDETGRVLENPEDESGKPLPIDVPVYCLTTYPIARTLESELESAALIDIDPLTMLPDYGSLPAKNAETSRAILPAIQFKDMLEHLEVSGALGVSFYGIDQRRFVSAVRVPKLLDAASPGSAGEDIWTAIKLGHDGDEDDIHFNEDAILVAPVNRVDIHFKNFIETRLAGELGIEAETVLIPRRDAAGGSFYDYFYPHAGDEKIKGKHVVLSIATVHTAEKLRNLIAILVHNNVARITVVCLLNRMGRQTAEFLGSIRKFLSQKGGEIPFLFRAVYETPELRSEDIVRMHSSSTRRLERAAERTPVHGFKRLVNQYKKYFRPNSLTGPSFQNGRPRALEHTRKLWFKDQEIEVTTREGILFLLTSDVASSDRRNYAAVIRELLATPDKETRLFLLAVILTNLQYIHVVGDYTTLRDGLIDRISTLRRKRMQLTRGVRPGDMKPDDSLRLRNMVETEVHYLFCLAMCCFLDLDFDYGGLVVDSLQGHDGRPHSDECLLSYCGSDSVLWCLSLLLHWSQPGFEANGNESLRSKVRNLLSRLVDRSEGIMKNAETRSQGGDKKYGDVATRAQATKTTLQFFLSDLGFFGERSPGDAIRFLHKSLVTPKRRHNPITTSMYRVFDQSLYPALDRLSHFKSARIPLERWAFDSTARDLQRMLELGVKTVSILEEVAQAAEELFQFAPISREKAGVFAVEEQGSKFSLLVDQLGRILEDARVENSLSASGLSEGIKLWSRIETELFDSKSRLREVMSWYVTDVVGVLRDELKTVGEELRAMDSRYEGLWAKELAKLETSPAPALIDGLLLREVLRNILKNVHHTFRGVDIPEGETWADRVSVEVHSAVHLTDELKSQSSRHHSAGDDFVQLIVRSIGKPPNKPDIRTTFFQHQFQVRELGGFLTIGDNGDPAGTRVELWLHTRRRAFTALIEKVPETSELDQDEEGMS